MPFVMADHRLARQMPEMYCNTFFYYCVAIMIVGDVVLPGEVARPRFRSSSSLNLQVGPTYWIKNRYHREILLNNLFV